jgi:eukaryotic-like serine/threonine-protein kinase
MGEVYRARDTKLDRDVAIKILPEAFALDADRVARFQREAKVLASLNHPNIAIIHGLEQAGDVHALVMELVPGEDLSQRVSRGAIPMDEALPIAKQIADALEAAHELGIIHRDLKPANIKVRPDGTVKVLDFGLAKAMEAGGAGQAGAAGRESQSMSPTITTPAMTQAGMILGTAAYMSPEQARGKPLNRRTDIWAFGCVLYEMLTGTRAFVGDDVSDVLASVLARDPDWARLPSTLSPAIGTYIRRCLEKNPHQRIGDVHDVRLALEGAFDTAAPLMSEAAVEAQPLRWRRLAMFTAGALVLGAVASGAAVWVLTRSVEPAPPRVSRLQFTPVGAAALSIVDGPRQIAIAGDGSHLAYIGNRGTQLFVRALDTLEPAAVFTRFPRDPFFSPDGQSIGFSDAGMLKKVAVGGGPAIPITTFDGPTSRGATWGTDDTIIFATTNGATGLQRVSAAGGQPTVLTRPKVDQGEADHAWPEWLPGGRAVLFTILAATGGLDAAQVAVLDLQTGNSKVLFRGGSDARYVSGDPGSAKGAGPDDGYLVYATAGTLRAVRFDLTRLETIGTPIAVVPEVVTMVNGAVDAVVANDGTLAYVRGSLAAEAKRALVWVDRHGTETPIPAPLRAYVQPRLSPDGKRVAVFNADQEGDIWLSDLGPALTRVTSGAGVESFPVWAPDNTLIFSSQSTSAGNLFRQKADGSGGVDRLSDSPNVQNATAILADGSGLIFTETSPKTGDDVMQMALDSTHRVTPLVQTSFAERNGVVSPDGHWLAYESNESGPFQIFVRPYPNVNGGRIQVSAEGGTRPAWARTSQELIFVSTTGALMRVGVTPAPSWTPPTLLVKAGYFTSPGNTGRTFDISPDGERLLMIKESVADAPTAPASIIVVQQWVGEMKRIVSTHIIPTP